MALQPPVQGEVMDTKETVDESGWIHKPSCGLGIIEMD
jgi:hypothetical protein